MKNKKILVIAIILCLVPLILPETIQIFHVHNPNENKQLGNQSFSLNGL